MITSFRNSPSFRQNKSSLVTEIPPVAGGGGYVKSLHKNVTQTLAWYQQVRTLENQREHSKDKDTDSDFCPPPPPHYPFVLIVKEISITI